MQIDRKFSEYSKEEQIQLMFQALKIKESDLNQSLEAYAILNSNLESVTQQNELLSTFNQSYSVTNYILWFGISIAFVLGFIMRGL